MDRRGAPVMRTTHVKRSPPRATGGGDLQSQLDGVVSLLTAAALLSKPHLFRQI